MSNVLAADFFTIFLNYVITFACKNYTFVIVMRSAY